MNFRNYYNITAVFLAKDVNFNGKNGVDSTRSRPALLKRNLLKLTEICILCVTKGNNCQPARRLLRSS